MALRRGAAATAEGQVFHAIGGDPTLAGMRRRIVMSVVLCGLLTVGVVRAAAEVPTPRLRLATAGDYGSSGTTDAVQDKIHSLSPDAAFAIGDLSYRATGDEQSWCDRVVGRV